MRFSLKPLPRQVMVITGASSGIGLVTARRAAAAGAAVMLVARTESTLRETVREIEEAGGRAAYAVADVGVAAEVEAAARAAVERFGRIDTWVNNAGTAIYAKLVDTPLAEHEHMFRTNYFGVVNGTTAALPHLRESRGALVTVASIAADIPSPILGAYAATKHAVKGYIESLRMELIADDVPVSVTLIKPSGIDTPIARRAARHIDGKAMIPPPTYDPELVADAILEAAVRPHRSITVGGVGRAQVLLGTHFPGVLDSLSKLLVPTINAPGQPRDSEDALFGPMEAGQARSGEQPGRRTSVYTAAEIHPATTLALGIGLAVVAGGLLLSRARRS
jgi:short-subunit dehydrogenase